MRWSERKTATAEVREGKVARWDEIGVNWDTLHNADTEGGHHARVARFLEEQGVDLVVADHMGDPMLTMLERMRIGVQPGAGGDARSDVIAAAPAWQGTTLPAA